MKLWGNFKSILLAALLLVLAGACVTPPPSAPGGTFYLTSDMTYLRDAAGFENHVVGQLYKGDQVQKLDTGESGWWRVRSNRTGQAGWVPNELLSPKPVPVAYVYVTQTVHLRECPKDLCPALQLLSRGAQVQKIEQNDQGWWRVLVIESHNLGWLPAKMLAENLEKAQAPGKSYLYVAVRRLNLFREPQPKAEVVKQLKVNDQVEKLDQNPAGWVKVRQPSSGAVGWVPGSYLETLPVRFPRGEKRKRPGHRTPAETEPPSEPEIM
jgi:uncharacterized protein YgiM (DUF1202 family)